MNGNLGNDSFINSNVPVDVVGISSGATSISANTQGTCATVNGGVKCWGDTTTGVGGTDALGRQKVPVWLNSLPAGSDATSISMNYYHSCAVVNGAASCWGLNTAGAVGNGTLLPNPNFVTRPMLVAPF